MILNNMLKKNLYNLITEGLPKGPRLTRYFLYTHLSNFRSEWPSKAKVLSISGSQNLCKIIGFNNGQINNVQYPEVNMLCLPFPDCEFDAVVSDQVLEHVEGSPYVAIKEAFRVVKPGGTTLHTTCFLNDIHGAPKDFWRFTPEALKILSKEYGQLIDCGGWGNPYALICIILGMRRLKIPHQKWHPYHWLACKNNEKWPIVTWVLCRKNNA
jgi:SAM-dependent methyltransferase